MRIKNLEIKNIGPFHSAKMDFISNDEELETPPIIIITGENGTGKSIIIDSLRSLFMGLFRKVEREITASKDFLIKSDIVINNQSLNVFTNSKKEQKFFDTNHLELSEIFHSQFESNFKKDFIIDYWTSKLASDSFDINSIIALEPLKYLDEALSGVHKNIDVTKVISFFDYLKDSKDEYEKQLGTSLYEILEKIINISIGEGTLSHISRIDLKPIIKVRNTTVSLDKLSSGNLYLIQRFTNLLRQVYSICYNNDIPITNYKDIKGILLIDEAENHLHPKWQKLFLNNILTLFPKLQIIVTTHSPFIVSSIENSRIYVCKSEINYSVVTEETDLYSNKPVEDILLSPLFNTSNFNIEISNLIKRRKDAVINNDTKEVSRIEKILLSKNPDYFNYLEVEDLIKSIKK